VDKDKKESLFEKKMDHLTQKVERLESHDIASLSEGTDRLSMDLARVDKSVNQFHQGVKRKLEDVDDCLADLDDEIGNLDTHVHDLEKTVQQLSLQVNKKRRAEMISSATVGACAAIAVIAGVIFGPEFTGGP
jgi:phage shock protein A